jgi:hypothetical protein
MRPTQRVSELISTYSHQVIEAVKKQLGEEISRQAVNQWRRRGVPPNRVELLSDIINVPPYKIRPDIFRPPKNSGAQHDEEGQGEGSAGR